MSGTRIMTESCFLNQEPAVIQSLSKISTHLDCTIPSQHGKQHNPVSQSVVDVFTRREHVRYWHEEAAANISHRCIPWTLANLVSDRKECRGFTHHEAGGTKLLPIIHKEHRGMTAPKKDSRNNRHEDISNKRHKGAACTSDPEPYIKNKLTPGPVLWFSTIMKSIRLKPFLRYPSNVQTNKKKIHQIHRYLEINVSDKPQPKSPAWDGHLHS